MKKNSMFIICINLLMCLMLCSCSQTVEDNFSNESNLGDSYVNIQFGTRSTQPGVEEDKELGVSHLRVIVFDSLTNKLEQNEVYTSSNAGRVPNPLLKVTSEQKKIVYVVANEEGKTAAAGISLTDALAGVATQADIAAVIVGVTPYNSKADLPGTGLLMLGRGTFTAKFGNSMLNPQVVSLGLERLTSKIVINARRSAGMTVKITSIKAKNFYNLEYLIAKTPTYDYPAGSRTDHAVPTDFDVPEKAKATFDNVGSYYWGTSFFQADPITNPTLIEVHYQITQGATTTPHVKKIEGLAPLRNQVVTLNLNFEQASVDITITVKSWDDVQIDGDVAGGTFASLSQSELTMYGAHNGTIYFKTDAANVTIEPKTQTGELVNKYFSTVTATKGATGLGDVQLTPIQAAMSQDPDKPTEIGLYVNFGNIRKAIKVKHINRDAYKVILDANGGSFPGGFVVMDDGTVPIGNGHTISNEYLKIPTSANRIFLGWALSETAFIKEFSPGDHVSYENMERPTDTVKFYALWGAGAKSGLIFDPNNKLVINIPSQIVGDPSTVVTIPTQKPTEVDGNYIFKEWNTKADGTGTIYAPGAGYTLDIETSVLYATWNSRPVKVQFIRNYEPNTILKTYNLDAGQRFTTLTEPSRSDWYFVEWNTSADGSGTAYETNKSYMAPPADMNLYAIWKKRVQLSFITPPTATKSYAPITGFKQGDVYSISPHDLFYFRHYELSRYISYSFSYINEIEYRNPVWYWQDVDSGDKYYYGNDVTMPDRHVVLKAVYYPFREFKMRNEIGGPTVYFSVYAVMKNGTGYVHTLLHDRFSYWGRHHDARFVDNEFADLRVKISTDWDPAPWFKIKVEFNDGFVRFVTDFKTSNVIEVNIPRSEMDSHGGLNELTTLWPNSDS